MMKHSRTSIGGDPPQSEGAGDGSWYWDPERALGEGCLMVEGCRQSSVSPPGGSEGDQLPFSGDSQWLNMTRNQRSREPG